MDGLADIGESKSLYATWWKSLHFHLWMAKGAFKVRNAFKLPMRTSLLNVSTCMVVTEVPHSQHHICFLLDKNNIANCMIFKRATSSEFGTYRLCEQRRFRRACASAQSRQNLRCSLIQAVSQEEHSDRKPDPWSLWIAGHAQLKFVMTECSKTQIRLTRHKYN